ncbi:EmrB/QacA family drug resistance transporter [Mycolicibacterium flavescens]|uniref:DHA2 family efflux MFS transporter permease subunit n=1 Tax=Mycobacterium neumannii TaxID=2048551 RepID=UPI000F715FE8|nr:DHA2 family efflux MFS transporter permease subunit [Mycobacterium neumannii]VEG38118.1 EmrB/QacA family drug resistance transporter [Mycolicibacterium flavescens]
MPTPNAPTVRPSLRAVWAMMTGFFLIVVDSTIVAVANPVIKEEFAASYHAVIWVTSAYLLAFAALLPVGGRLGDRFGPKTLYVAGLAAFTLASLWCGVSESIGMLIAGRVAQGVGAALMTPQTLSAVTRIFPPQQRGVPVSLWGATAGLGLLVGPVAGGLLVDALGWRSIFLVNIPIGAVGLVLALRLIPALPTRPHRLDMLGVLLSGAGICLIVFALQEGRHHAWGPTTWAAIAGGCAFLAGFVLWQSIQRSEPLVPLDLFRHRDFALSNLGIALISFTIVAFAVPLMFYLQDVRGMTATHAGLVTAPMAVATGVLAPIVGRLVDRVAPRSIVCPGFTLTAVALVWLALEMNQSAPVWRMTLPLMLIGAAGALTWEPLAVTASRTLPDDLAGAGSAVFNTIRQIGAALGSASIAALLTAQADIESHDASELAPELSGTAALEAMSHSMLLPATVAGLGAIAAIFFTGPSPRAVQAVSHSERNVSTGP